MAEVFDNSLYEYALLKAAWSISGTENWQNAVALRLASRALQEFVVLVARLSLRSSWSSWSLFCYKRSLTGE